MDRIREPEFLKFAQENGSVLCKNAPFEILEECSHDIEPTPFLEQFFEIGYKKWFAYNTGYDITPPKYEITNAIILLHYRATKMYSHYVLKQDSPYDEIMFFSNEN